MSGITTRSTCPQCEGRVTEDPKRGEYACTDCGTIVQEDVVDRGPEWKAYSVEENDRRSRVGAPTTQIRHDKGLSTKIGHQRFDAKGNALSSKKRSQIARLRTWNNRCQAYNGAERTLKQGLVEINRMASALGLPKSTRETASVIYRRALSCDVVRGRSIEGVATGALYAATRQEGIPRTLDEMAGVSRVEYGRIGRDYREITSQLGLSFEPTDPTAYIPRFASKLDCDDGVRRRATAMCELVAGTAFTSGKSPVGVAAAALYAAGQHTGRRITQREVSNVADVSCMTIRCQYQEIIDRFDDQ